MKKRTTIKIASLLVLFVAIFQFSCKHELPAPACNGSYFKIAATQTAATVNQNNGSITATASGGSGFQYSLNGGAYQDTGYFSGLEPFKNYNLVGRNAIGCTDTMVLQLDSFDPCLGVNINVMLSKTDATVNQSNG